LSQHDLDIANQTFPNTRSDLNNALKALGSTSSGAIVQSTTYSNQLWYDTANNKLYIRNEDNDANIEICELDQSNDTVEYFKSDSIRTALVEYSDGTDAFTIGSDGTVAFDTNTLYVDATNNKVGIGTTSPDGTLHVETASSGATANTSADELVLEGTGNVGMSFLTSTTGANRIYFGDSGNALSGVIKYDHNIDAMFFDTNGSERIRIDSSGNVGIGTSSPSSPLEVVGGAPLASGFTQSRSGHPTFGITNGGTDSIYFHLAPSGGSHQTFMQVRDDDTDVDSIAFSTSGTEAMRIDSSGRVGIGTSSPDQNLHVSDTSSNAYIKIISNDSNTAGILFGDQNSGLQGKIYYVNSGDYMRFDTNGSERMRITSEGRLGIGTTSPGNPLSVIGNAIAPAKIVRNTNDGGLILFVQDGVTEGTITVSGSTVSYNGGHLSRWGRLPDGSQPTILKGTVMSNLDEMVVWSYDDVLYTEEDELPEGKSVGDVKTPAYTAENEQRNQLKVSDVEGDVNVAGLFVKWDTEEDGYNDIDLAMTGDMVIRIAQGTTVQRGDLLMSAGDGTAKPQGDDIVRSKTIAKVTSTTVINTYDDGSYVVPCVVMAC